MSSDKKSRIRRTLYAVRLAALAGFPAIASAAAPAPQARFELPAITTPSPFDQSVETAAVQFEGNVVISSEELHRLAAPYIGRSNSIGALSQLCETITRLYVERGYINSGALLAGLPQNGAYPRDIVPIRIVEGRVTQLQLQGMGRLTHDYVGQRLLRPREALNLHTLQERVRLLLTDPLFSKMNSRILPGEAPGEAILAIDVVRARPYFLTIFANNQRPPSVGSEAVGITGQVWNVTGQGDSLSLTFQHSESGNPFQLGWTVPVGGSGASVGITLARGQSVVIEEPLNSVDITSRSESAEATWTAPLLSSLGRQVQLGLSLGERQSQSNLMGEPFSFSPGEVDGRASVKAVRLALDWTERSEGRALAARTVLSHGWTNRARPDLVEAAPARRYTIVTGQFQAVRSLSQDGIQLVIRGSAQVASERLASLERFALGGASTVRGYRENAVVRDRGYVLGSELRYPAWGQPALGAGLVLVAFAEFGQGRNVGEAGQRLGGAGIGASWRGHGISADLFAARKLVRLPVTTRGNLQDRGIHFTINYALL